MPELTDKEILDLLKTQADIVGDMLLFIKSLNDRVSLLELERSLKNADKQPNNE